MLEPLLFLALATDFSQVKPILEKACLQCHNAKRNYAGLRIDTKEMAMKGGQHGPAIVPGDPEMSTLYRTSNLPAGTPGAMPPGGPQMSAADREILRSWIAEGAKWPDGVALGTPAPKLADDLALVTALHGRISKGARGLAAAGMKPYTRTIAGSEIVFEMAVVPGGEFEMAPGRKVKIDPLWMAKTEVTWDAYRLFMFHQAAGTEPEVDAVSHPTRPYVEMSFGMGIDGFPAISMTQHAANKFAQWLSAKTGEFYRLPTEAEWQYACRAGGDAKLPQPVGDYAWYADNSNGKYQKVGTKKPNAFGLHDMIGNVMEWTLDQYAPFAPGSFTNPWVTAKEPYPHAVLGGSWNDPAEGLGCSARVGSDASWKMQDPQLPKSIWYHTDAQWLGFRVVRPLKIPAAAEMNAYWNSGVEQEP